MENVYKNSIKIVSSIEYIVSSQERKRKEKFKIVSSKNKNKRKQY